MPMLAVRERHPSCRRLLSSTGQRGRLAPGDNALRARELAGMDLQLEQAWTSQRCAEWRVTVVRNGWVVFENILGARVVPPIRTWRPRARLTDIACGSWTSSVKIPRTGTKVFSPVLPEAFATEATSMTRRAEITPSCWHAGGYNGEGNAPTAVVMGRAFRLRLTGTEHSRPRSVVPARWTNAGAGYSYSSPEPHRLDGAAAHHGDGVASIY